MTIQPEEFLEFAEYLYKNVEVFNSEPKFRTIVNRCYLASVLKAGQILEPIFGELPRDITYYESVENALADRNAPASKDMLFELRKQRNESDYNWHINI